MPESSAGSDARGDRCAAAMAAAGAVASRYLRSAVQPRLIVAGADFVVALDPLPVIARVTSIAEDHQGRIPPALQVELARYAAHRDGPVVAPWPAGAGPFDIGEFVVTLWERAPNRPVSPESVGHALHDCTSASPGRRQSTQRASLAACARHA